MVDQTVRRVADESSVSVVMDRRCSARRVKRTRDPGPERLGKENAPAATSASAPQGARVQTCPLLPREDTHFARHTRPAASPSPASPASLTFPGGESKVAEIGRFVLNKRNRGFESIPLRQRVLSHLNYSKKSHEMPRVREYLQLRGHRRNRLLATAGAVSAFTLHCLIRRWTWVKAADFARAKRSACRALP
jgi:hypothetical protein